MPSKQDTTKVSAAIAPSAEVSATYRLVKHLTPYGALSVEMDIQSFRTATMLQYFEATKFASAHTGTLSQRLLNSGNESWHIPMVIPLTPISGEEQTPCHTENYAWRLQTTLSPRNTPRSWAFEPFASARRGELLIGPADFHSRLFAPQAMRQESSLPVLSVSPALELYGPKDRLLSSVYMALLLADVYIQSYKEAVWDEDTEHA